MVGSVQPGPRKQIDRAAFARLDELEVVSGSGLEIGVNARRIESKEIR